MTWGRDVSRGGLLGNEHGIVIREPTSNMEKTIS